MAVGLSDCHARPPKEGKKKSYKVSGAVTLSLSATKTFYKSGSIVISVNGVISEPHHSHTEYTARHL